MRVLEELGYLDSPKFIQPSRLHTLPPDELVFALRKCRDIQDPSIENSFRGAYVIQRTHKEPAVPIVYTFQLETEEAAKQVHRLVWNQNLAPFVIVESPSMIRVYSGFSYDKDKDNPLKSILKNIGSILQELSGFCADAIDDGSLWQQWGDKVDPTKRVDERLLKDLKQLDQYLQSKQLPRSTSHGIIGKYVYLHYLRARGILSDRKLENWKLKEEDIFSSNATLKAFRKLNNELQDWLNGSVFPLGEDSLSSLSQEQLGLVAGVFKGDSISQLALDFRVYDFSYIPIETLSCVYEQFLHDTVEKDGKSLGKKLSAYYTPIPLTDYIISELESRRPFKKGMKILDPSCGSGSFLVQCYRRIIEKTYRAIPKKKRLTPKELRELLVNHIYGVDKDQDACHVTELSLILTLLDYVNPPDLENTTFKLPKLCGENIFESDFFDPNSEWQTSMNNVHFDWIVGNPPWAEVKGEPLPNHEHYFVWKWIKENKSSFPIGGNQIAECFLWKVGHHSKENSVVGLLVPAMTWFKNESISFRQHFFSERQVWCLSNFSNMAFVLFGGRITPRASAIFFECIQPKAENKILSFAPFVVEQIANRSPRYKTKLPTWNIIVNANEIKEVKNEWASSGKMLVWKLAMWGSYLDKILLQKLENQFPKFVDIKDKWELIAHQGLELRKISDSKKEKIERNDDLIGKKFLDMRLERNGKKIFSFPENSLLVIKEDNCFLRKGRSILPKKVSMPPHIILNAARQFAVFTNDFIGVPARQIGITGPKEHEKYLRALSIFLSSDFSKYHQFFNSPQFGVERDIADLKTLKHLPVPLESLNDKELVEWCDIQKNLAALSKKEFNGMGLSVDEVNTFEALTKEMNSKVFDLLQLRSSEKILIHDFVHLHFNLMSGKVTNETIRKPKLNEIREYLITLRNTLDGFLSDDQKMRHKIEVIHDNKSAMFSISIVAAQKAVPFNIFDLDNENAKHLRIIRDTLRHRHSQWIYFDRGLKIYEAGKLYQFKPMQRLHWTGRQAILDADEIIAESLNESEPS